MAEPTPAVFHRATPLNRFVTAFMATRPAFLSASILPVLAGLALAWHITERFNLALGALTVITIALIHAGANVLNDFCDARNGTDDANRERIYPFSGGSRFIQNRVFREQETLQLAVVLLSSGALGGLALVWMSGPLLMLIGAVGGALAIAYSAPPFLAGRGLGDFTIILAFGTLPVAGTVYVQTGTIPDEAWWIGTGVGLFASAILWVNSIPDITADALAGKRTLPVRLGAARARYGLPILFGAGFVVLVAGSVPAWMALAAFPAIAATWMVLRNRLTAAIPLTLLSHATVCLFLVLAYL